MALPEHIEELEDEDKKFAKHFEHVRRRTRSSSRIDKVKTRILPTASQQSQRSPEVDAMAQAFVAADRVLNSDLTGDEGSEREDPGEESGHNEQDENMKLPEELDARDGEDGPGDTQEDAPMDDVDDVMANLDEFLNPWDGPKEETEFNPLNTSPLRRTSRVSRPSFRVLRDIEAGGW
jgi:hypothetical protein